MDANSSLSLVLASGCLVSRRIYRDFLQESGIGASQVIESDTVFTTLQSCQAMMPDVLLLDVALQDGNGLEVLQQLRSQIPATQMVVILLSDQLDIHTAIQAIQQNAQNYLSRDDLTATRLNHAIQEALSQRKQARKLVEFHQPQQQLIATIALRIRQSLHLNDILSATTREVRDFLKTERVLVYQFHPDMSGTIVAESVSPGWTATLGAQVQDTYFQQDGALAYQQGRKQVVNDIYQANLTECHVTFLEQFQVRAILVVPILVMNQLWGLLVAHHCSTPRIWRSVEVELLEHLAVQIAIAIQQANAYQQAQTELAERIQFEQHLSESEERFRKTFEQAAVGIAHVSPDGHFIRVNQRFCEITGYGAPEMLALTLQEITHPDDLATDLRQMRNLLRGQLQTYSVEKRAISKSRVLVWINLTLSLVYDLEGHPKYFIAVIENITSRKQIEAERLQTEKIRLELKLLDAILDVILAGYWDTDIPNNQQYISPGFKRMFGYEDHELANSPETWKQLILPEDLPGALASFERHVQSHGQIPYYGELRYRHKNGSTVWVICSGRVIAWDQDGKPLRMIGCHIDITKRKQAEEALETYTREIQDLYDNAPCGYHSLDPNGHIIKINETELRWLGYSREEVMGQSITALMSPESVHRFQESYPIFKEQGQIKDLELDLVCKDGTVFPVLVSATAVKDAAGTYLHSRSTLFDVRDRKQAEVKLMQMNQELTISNFELARATKMKDEFMANMSHELRTPLNAVLGISESLLEEVLGPLNETQKQSIAIVEQSGQHLLGLINDILDVSKIEVGKLELHRSMVSILELCQSSLNFVKQQALKKQIQLGLMVPANMGDIAIDERRIRQVLINLLTNAVKFTPTRGQVTLEAHYEPLDVNLGERIPISVSSSQSRDQQALETASYLCISILDTGIGIAPADQANLFRPFVQIDSALNRQFEGTGLGLVLVKRIVELHGGDVSLTSHVGQGSCFTIRLPCVCLLESAVTPVLSSHPEPMQTAQTKRLPEPLPVSETVSKKLNSPLILVAEDNEANIITLSTYLEAKGYGIIVAPNGREAIDRVKSHLPDLVLMDIQMPGMDGLEAIQLIRQLPDLGNVPIIALTALAMPGDRDRCLAAGADDYLSKPVKFKQLISMLNRFL